MNRKFDFVAFSAISEPLLKGSPGVVPEGHEHAEPKLLFAKVTGQPQLLRSK
jgi:hypothetical protein